MNKRVVVTGLGVISSIGIGKKAFWDNLLKGKSGIKKVTLFDTSKFHRHYAGEVKNFIPSRFIPKRKEKYLGRASQFAIAAVNLALRDTGLPENHLKNRHVAVVIGATIPEGNTIDLSSRMILSRKADKIETTTLLNIYTPAIARNLGNFFKTKGINVLIPNACAAGNYAISHAFDLIKRGDTDFAIAGGSEALSRIAFQGFQRLHAMSPRSCSPFDKNRKGMLMGEGAGILILESLDSAKKRKASIYAEVLGYGLSCDAHHITIPKKDGVRKAMQKALKNSHVSVNDVDFICAHGTGTQANDKAEATAINELFDTRNKNIPVSSIKSMIGHCMGAVSSIEAIACCLAIQDKIIPPTINFKTPDPECNIDCVPNKARAVNELNVAVNNGFAFGGNNCSVVFRSCSNF